MPPEQPDLKTQEQFGKALNAARAFDITPVIRRYMAKEKVTSDRAKIIADEMLKYLAMCSVKPLYEWTITGEVDEMWHTFILFTVRYEDFCKKVAGRFIHHYPANETSQRDAQDDGSHPSRSHFDTYTQTLEHYRLFLHSEPDSTVWPSPLVFKRELDMLERGQDPMPCGACGGGGPFQPCGCGPIKPDPIDPGPKK